MPAVLSLPSGLKLPTAGLVAYAIREDGSCDVDWLSIGMEEPLQLHRHDAAAVHAALSRFGYEADAPTLKGDDADGDGRTGE
jgi:hypothetical protein